MQTPLTKLLQNVFYDYLVLITEIVCKISIAIEFKHKKKFLPDSLFCCTYYLMC